MDFKMKKSKDSESSFLDNLAIAPNPAFPVTIMNWVEHEVYNNRNMAMLGLVSNSTAMLSESFFHWRLEQTPKAILFEV